MIIRSLNVGLPRSLEWKGKTVNSSIFKEPVLKPVSLDELNFAGNGQADLVNHGGPDKAVNAYFAAHYPYWEQELGRTLTPGAFGENLTLAGATEADVCIGDVWRAGGAVLQVSQPRIPCYKLAARHGVDDLPERVIATGYTGFYFRVLTPGVVAPGDMLELVQRPAAAISVAVANRIMHHDKQDWAGVRALLAAAGLAAAWREMLSTRLARHGPAT